MGGLQHGYPANYRRGRVGVVNGSALTEGRPVVALTSIVLMWLLPLLLKALRVPALMTHLPAWVGLTVLILTSPVLLPVGAPLMLTEFSLGVVFALYYGSMTSGLKHVVWPRAEMKWPSGLKIKLKPELNRVKT